MPALCLYCACTMSTIFVLCLLCLYNAYYACTMPVLCLLGLYLGTMPIYNHQHSFTGTRCCYSQRWAKHFFRTFLKIVCGLANQVTSHKFSLVNFALGCQCFLHRLWYYCMINHFYVSGAAAPGFNSLIPAPSVPSLISTEPVELLYRASNISSTDPFCFVKQKTGSG